MARRPRPRPLAAFAAWAVLAGGVAVADEGPKNQIHYPLNEELAGLLSGAERAVAEGDLATAVEIYRSVLDADDPRRYQVVPDPERGPTEARRFVGATEWTIRALRRLPAEGRELFRARYDYRARSALDRALRAEDPLAALARAYELFPISSHAWRAVAAFADQAFERGELARAARALGTLLTHHADEVPDLAAVHRKRVLCSVGRGDAARLQASLDALRRHDPEATVHLGDAPVSDDELTLRALRVEAIQTGRAHGHRASARHVRGDAGNRAYSPAPVAFGEALFSPRTFDDPGRIRGLGVRQFGSFAPAQSRTLPIVHQGVAYVVTADEVHAFDLQTGQEVRRIRRPPKRPFLQDNNAKVQFGGALSRGILAAPLVEEVRDEQSFRGIPIKVDIPVRKLAGFDVDPDRWSWEWDHALLLRGTPMEGWSFPCPPSAEEGRLFASAFAIEGFVDCHVAAFDARTGRPLWSTWVASGQVEQTMFGEQACEPLCVPVALAEGTVYHCTSFGAVAALDADTGRPRWISEYEQVEVRAPKGYHPDRRPIVWENNAPVVDDGVVVATPLDSGHVYAFDAESGRRLWAAPARWGSGGDMRYVVGVHDGRLVLAGGNDVRCHDLRGGKVLWRTPFQGRVVSGRGIIADRYACIPVDNNKLITVDLVTGKRAGLFDLAATGNLLLCGDALLVAGNGSIVAHRNGARLPQPTERRKF